ncbi:hypothetical protein [Actinoplanes sp. GCM10030250]|uniref:hypothetical protein n=1 Tax=Actinoplanes sp. GCM10030250 TaxID=3273376 RepID=UPI00361F18E3
MEFVRMFVSYCQYEVLTATGSDRRLDIYTVGDELLHVGGRSVCTAFTGLHTGHIELRVVVSDEAPPGPDREDWDAVSETTIWCPDGRFTVLGLMGNPIDQLRHVAVPRPGLIRVRVHARDRIHESVRTDDDPPEQHEVHVWPVEEETGHRTVFADGIRAGWAQKTGQAAGWAMAGLVTPQQAGPGQDGAELPRVTVVRRRPAPVRLPEEAVLPAGDLEIRLSAGAGKDTLTWEWAVAAAPIFPVPVTALPDDRPTTVRLHLDEAGDLTLRHEDVPGKDAVTLGLLWDHLLDGPAVPAWQAPLEAEAAAATERAESYRRRNTERLAAAWGGTPPSERVRTLIGRAKALAKLDRPLLDRLAELPPARQREVARRAARRAMEVAGLDRIDWIAEALTAADAGEPLPPGFADFHTVFNRLLSDPGLPQETVRIPAAPAGMRGGPGNMLRAALAFPALLAVGKDDPLAAAVDATYIAAISFGDDYRQFLAGLREEL